MREDKSLEECGYSKDLFLKEDKLLESHIFSMDKYCDKILENNLDYNDALSQLDKGLAIGRIDSKELHYLSNNNLYCILYEDGTIKKNMLDKVSDKARCNWCLLKLNDKAIELIEQ